ncbi:glutathione S-transferase D7-like [Schistocerca americana]|uniref:glutathione S-transferase D7-like n=1 Tax=Schistocerca americana TaxID=7009 RepID=UPI001F4F4FD8|nr:glutathione S-transferase D7-like [Schistocerca americana]
MPVVLYHFPASPPSRIALAAAKVVGVDVNIKIVDLFAKEQLKEEFVKINPQHTIPTIDDNGFVLWDSHAIATYFMSQYGKDDSLYPKEPKKRAVVDQRIYFEAGTLFPRMRAIVFPVIFLGNKSVEASVKAAAYEAIGFLEKFLEATRWVAGDHLTIADVVCAVTATSMQAIGLDFSGYPKTQDWIERCKKIPGFQEANEEGVKAFGEKVRSSLPPNHLAP